MKKSEKRKQKENDRGIVDFMMIQNHFFSRFQEWIEQMIDPRHPSYIKYTQSDLIYMGILKNVCSLKTMRQMEERFNEEVCIENLSKMSNHKGLDEMPHYDTLNYYLERLSPDCLSELRRKMVKSLIRGKHFYSSRLSRKYWRVILDGTGLYCFKERHCANCLSTTRKYEDGKTIKLYYHKVLEAKLVLSNNIVISIGTEFIENESENIAKQDCEINAAKRILKRIKNEYKRLPLCIQGDALYAVEPIMEICRENNWEYIFTLKDTRMKVVAEYYEWVSKGGGKTEVVGICEGGTGSYINHVEEIADKTEIMNVFEYKYILKKKKQKVDVKFQWITSIELNKRNIEEMIAAGRGRWKIENEGFNNQKNGIYQIEHINSKNSTAMKNHYLITQISDIIMQLYLAWNPLIDSIKQSIKNTSSRLLESFRRQTVTDEDVSYTKKYRLVYLE